MLVRYVGQEGSEKTRVLRLRRVRAFLNYRLRRGMSGMTFFRYPGIPGIPGMQHSSVPGYAGYTTLEIPGYAGYGPSLNTRVRPVCPRQNTGISPTVTTLGNCPTILSRSVVKDMVDFVLCCVMLASLQFKCVGPHIDTAVGPTYATSQPHAGFVSNVATRPRRTIGRRQRWADEMANPGDQWLRKVKHSHH